jgi:homospermidine synthase
MISVENFASQIERIRREAGVGYIDAVVAWCDGVGCELESAATLVRRDRVMREKLLSEAVTLHLVRGVDVGAKLPI